LKLIIPKEGNTIVYASHTTWYMTSVSTSRCKHRNLLIIAHKCDVPSMWTSA